MQRKFVIIDQFPMTVTIKLVDEEQKLIILVMGRKFLINFIFLFLSILKYILKNEVLKREIVGIRKRGSQNRRTIVNQKRGYSIRIHCTFVFNYFQGFFNIISTEKFLLDKVGQERLFEDPFLYKMKLQGRTPFLAFLVYLLQS